MHHFVGLDWASKAHAVCIVDARGSVISRFEVAHDETGLTQLQERLSRIDGPTIAIERPEGVLIDTLLDAGFNIVAIHPNVVKAARSRYRTAGKSDSGDAYILADLLRTDGHRFKALIPHASEIKALRLLVRLRKDSVRTRVGLSNQLRSVLLALYPGAAQIFADIDSPIALAFLRAFPSEAHAAKLTERRLQRFLTENSYCGRRSATELLARLRNAPRGVLTDEVAETGAVGVIAVVETLVPLVMQITSLTVKIDARLRELPDAKIVQSFPGSGSVTAAMILAKLGSDRERRLADNSRKRSAWAADRYRQARDRGCDHPHAIRILARAWARVIWKCWRDQALYDPVKHGQAARFAAQG